MNIKLAKFKEQIISNLKLQIIIYAIGSFLLSVICFIALNSSFQFISNNYIEPAKNSHEVNEAIQQFQNYITKNNISSTDSESIGYWSEENGRVFILQTVKNPYERHAKEISGQLKTPADKYSREKKPHAFEVITPIKYFDTTLNTCFLFIPSRTFYLISISIATLISLILFSFIFYKMLKKKLDYIHDIETGISILESGDLSYHMPIQGNDELSRLAVSINYMSGSFAERIKSEQQAIQSGKDIIGDLSHDIRTPLTILSGYIPLLLESTPLTEQQTEYLELIRKKTEQMSKRINELLDYATIYSGQTKLEKTELQVKTLVAQLVEELIPLNADISDITTANSCIEADPVLIERVFDNILSNLHKYANLQNKIYFTCYEIDEFLNIQIENTISLTAPADGKSLGLKITAFILEKHGGSLTTEQIGTQYKTILRLPLLGV